MWPGRRRRFKRGMLKYVLLSLLAHEPRHGYDLMRHFAERGWGRLGAGTLYPVLAMLEQIGYIEGRDEEGKRTYRITDEGKRRLHEMAEELESEFGAGDEPEEMHGELRGAMQRLAGAVAQAEHTAKAETLAQIAQRLNAARKEIYTLLGNE
jgi:DNA-binding PadR family transcriptional regulator